MRDSGIARAVEAAYRSTIVAGVRPSFFLNVTVPALEAWLALERGDLASATRLVDPAHRWAVEADVPLHHGVLEAIVVLAEWAPLLFVLGIPAAFAAFIAQNDASQHQPNEGMFAAYPQTVQQILAAFPSQ